jgi:lipopolysaccharide biosynthesis regulator YciM
MTVRPAAFNLVARRFAASATALGRQGVALERLQALYDRAPTLDLLETIASLQSDDGSRDAKLLDHLREHPTIAAASAVVATRAAAGDETSVALSAALRRAARPLHRYRCAACGFEAEHYFWQCPGCLGWDTYPPQRLEDL